MSEAASQHPPRVAADAPKTSRSKPRGARQRGAKQTGPRASFKQLLPYLFEQRGLLTFIIVLSLVSAVVSLSQPLLVGQVIERVQDARPLGALVAILVVIVVLGAILDGYQHYLLQRMGEGVVLRSRRRLIAKILHLPISEFDRRRTGDLVSRVGSDTTLLRAVLTQGLVEAVGGSLLFVGALIGMLIIDPVLFLITFGIIGVSLVVVVLLAGRIRPAVSQAQEKVGDLAAAVDRAIGSMRTIRAAGAADREQAAIEQQAEEAYGFGLKIARISALIVPISFIALQVSLLSVLGFGGYRVASGAIGVSQLVTFVIFLFMMITPLGQAFGAFAAVNQALGALGRIQEIDGLSAETDHDPTLSPSGSIVALDAARDETAPAIRFDDVRFTYRSAAPDRVDARELVRGRAGRDAAAIPAEIVETPVLHGISFDVPRGTRVALVGPSGAGKSTVLGLIERFYDPDSGAVSLFGADLRTLDRSELRAQLGYVEQDAPVLAGTLRDNLLLASPNATDAACERVLRAVNLGGVLDRSAATGGLESGLDAQVGENGLMLSGGEKQRLAIARALLTAPPILLLDESTASLDGVNERLMREALDSVATGRTLVVIAHRLSTVVDSDKIIVVDDGRVIGEGTHAELVDSVPLYRELAQHQLLVPQDAVVAE
ncbi:ABC transporter ATP-binding protein [Leucobacter sp. BZR 635]